MIGLAFAFIVIGFVVLPALVLGSLRAGSAPWRRRFSGIAESALPLPPFVQRLFLDSHTDGGDGSVLGLLERLRTSTTRRI